MPACLHIGHAGNLTGQATLREAMLVQAAIRAPSGSHPFGFSSLLLRRMFVSMLAWKCFLGLSDGDEGGRRVGRVGFWDMLSLL